MRPTSLSAPVATITTRPAPPVTTVPRNTMLWRSATAAFRGATILAPFATGVLSPVSIASFIVSRLAATTRPSAGTISSRRNSMTSPGTSSSPGISRSAPSRNTRETGARLSLRLLIVSSARVSASNPMAPVEAVYAKNDRGIIYPAGGERQQRAGRQQCNRQILELAEQYFQLRASLQFSYCIGAILGEPLLCLALGQSRWTGAKICYNSVGIHRMPGCMAGAAIRILRIEGAFGCLTEAVGNFADVALVLKKHEDRARRGAGGDRVDTAPQERYLQRPLHAFAAFQPVDPEAGAAWDCCMDRQHCRGVHPACPAVAPREAL